MLSIIRVMNYWATNLRLRDSNVLNQMQVFTGTLSLQGSEDMRVLATQLDSVIITRVWIVLITASILIDSLLPSAAAAPAEPSIIRSS